MNAQRGKNKLKATQQTIKFFETLLHASSDGIVITDAAQNIILVNQAFCTFLGRRWQDVIETNLFVWLDQLDANGAQSWAELERRVRLEGECHDVEFRLPGPEPVGDRRLEPVSDAEVKRLSVNASLLEQVADEESGVIISIWRDITEWARVQERIRQQNEFLNATLESLTHPFYVIDADDRSIVLANSASNLPETLTTCYAAIHKRDKPCPGDECLLAMVKKTGKPAQVEHVLYDRDDNPRIFEVHGYPMFDQQDQVCQMIEYSLDITQRKRTEQALKEYSERLEEMVQERTQELHDAQAELLRQEKLAMLGKLAGGVAHELRTPLGNIKNSAYFLNLVLTKVEPEAQEVLTILNEEVRVCERIINSLLNFARTKSPVQRYTNLHDVIQATLSHMDIPENVQLAYLAEDELSPVLTDPEQLGMVLGNIARNAIQAMPEGGCLSITVKELDAEWAVVSISDTGAGMSQEHLQQVFEPFFTTRARGIGLGLALARDLVEANGGRIEAQSQLGQGSVFSVYLPLALDG